MKKNRILSLLLAVVLVLSLVACSNGKDKDGKDTETNGETASIAEGTEITVQADEGWEDYYKAAAERVEKSHPGTKVNISVIGAFDHMDVIQNTDTTNKDVADLYALPADRFEDYKTNDYLAALPAKEIAEKLGGYSDFDNSLGGAFKDGDDYLAFPYNIETLVTFINKANAETAGIDVEKPLEVANAKHASEILLPLFDAWYGVAPNLAGGLEFLAKTDSGFESTYTGAYADLNETQKAVFDEIYNYWKKHSEAKTVLFDADAAWGYIDEEFKTGGNGVALLSGPWDAGKFQELAGEENMEVKPINHITVAGQALKHWQGGWALVANSRTEEDTNKLALVVAMIEEILNPDHAVDLYKATGKILENIDAKVYTDSDLSQLDKDIIANVFESYKVSEPRPLFKEYGQVWDTWKNGVLSWNTANPADAEAAYKELNASFTTMMQQFQ